MNVFGCFILILLLLKISNIIEKKSIHFFEIIFFKRDKVSLSKYKVVYLRWWSSPISHWAPCPRLRPWQSLWRFPPQRWMKPAKMQKIELSEEQREQEISFHMTAAEPHLSGEHRFEEHGVMVVGVGDRNGDPRMVCIGPAASVLAAHGHLMICSNFPKRK